MSADWKTSDDPEALRLVIRTLLADIDRKDRHIGQLHQRVGRLEYQVEQIEPCAGCAGKHEPDR